MFTLCFYIEDLCPHKRCRRSSPYYFRCNKDASRITEMRDCIFAILPNTIPGIKFIWGRVISLQNTNEAREYHWEITNRNRWRYSNRGMFFDCLIIPNYRRCNSGIWAIFWVLIVNWVPGEMSLLIRMFGIFRIWSASHKLIVEVFNRRFPKSIPFFKYVYSRLLSKFSNENCRQKKVHTADLIQNEDL